jgi:MFS superfamily sulfate permease-like transporter
MKKDVFSDLRASIVVFLVALPLCLGIALASGAPLSAGLVAGIVGGMIASSISDSRLSVSGPAAGLAVIVSKGIQDMGGFEAFCVTVFLSGIIQIILSRIKAGVIGNFFPASVINGMLSAIGLILILKQIPHALGFDSAFMGNFEFFQEEDHETTFSGLMKALNAFDPESVMIALVSLGVIQVWDRMSTKMNIFFRSIPAALVAVVVGTLLSEWVFGMFGMSLDAKHRVSLPFEGGMSELYQGLVRPDWSALGRASTYLVALTIAIVGSLESLLSVDAADKIDPNHRSSSKNRELLAQGVSNTISGFLGGLPITAVIVRTSANVAAGAKTRLSGILHGCWLLLSVILIPGLLNRIPIATLAVILILVGYKLTRPSMYLKFYKKGFDQFVPFIITILAILLTDLLKGIAIGVLIGFMFVIKRSHHKAMIMVKDHENNYLIRFMKDISFLQKHELMLYLRAIPAGASITIDGGGDIFIDEDVIGLIEDFVQAAELNQIKVKIKKSKSAIHPFFRE